jgi:hypothetical protein
MQQWNKIKMRYHDVFVSIVVRFQPNPTCYYFQRIDTSLCSRYQCLVISKRSTPDNKNVTFPSTFRHQSQISNILGGTSLEKGMLTFDRLMTTSKQIQLWHCVTVFVIRDSSTQFYQVHLRSCILK